MSSEYTYLQNKKFRAITYDWESISKNGLGTKLYCLTDFQANWLLSNTEYMAWLSRWQNCPCTPEELALMKADLDLNLMSCIDFQPYQIEYTYNQAVAEQLGVFDTDYTGIPSSVNPNTPDDFFSGDGSPERIDALCTACKVYLYSYAQNWIVKAQITLGVTVATAFLLSITIVGGVIAGTVLAGLAFITQIALDAFQDEDALDDVICCMRDAMQSTVINQANFETSLDSCGFIVGSNQAIIRDIIASDLLQLSNYLSFLNTLGDQFILAQAGVVDCPCDLTWQHTFDFIVDNTAQGWIPYIARALLTPAGWIQQPADLNTVQIQRSFVTSNVTKLQIFNGGLASGICGQFYSWRFPDVVGADGIINTNSSISNVNITSDGIWFSLCTGNDTGVTIQKIIIDGTGINPFLP